ncbi:MAG: hypothetical protein WD490_01330 [Opitutales bacterium]
MLRSNSTYEGSCYTSANTAKWIAAGILYKSYSLFTEARVIKNLEKLLAYQDSDPGSDTEIQNDISFALNNVFQDKISILIALENIIKAKLLLKGYVIHKVDHRIGNGKFVKLYKKQRSTPLRIEEVFLKERIEKEKEGDYVFESLSASTLEIPLFLDKQSYIRAIGLPDKLRSVLEKFLKDEKTLHFLAPKEYYGSAQNLQNFEILRRYIASETVEEYNDLATEMEYPPSQLIRRP